jgi:hypothetical protein
MFAGLSLDPGFGKRMPLLVLRAGLSLRYLEDITHLEAGTGLVALVMRESARTLREKYVATGEATSKDVDQYVHGAGDPSSLAIYYSTVGIVATKGFEGDER